MKNNIIFRMGANISSAYVSDEIAYSTYYKKNKTFDGYSKNISINDYKDAIEYLDVVKVGLYLSPIVNIVISLLLSFIAMPFADLIISLTRGTSRIVIGGIFLILCFIIICSPTIYFIRELIYVIKYIKYLLNNYESRIQQQIKVNNIEKSRIAEILFNGGIELIVGFILLQVSWILDQNDPTQDIIGLLIIGGAISIFYSYIKAKEWRLYSGLISFVLMSVSLQSLETDLFEKLWMVFLALILSSLPIYFGVFDLLKNKWNSKVYIPKVKRKQNRRKKEK